MAVMTPEELRKAFEKLATHMGDESKRADVSWGHIADAVEASSKHLTTGWGGAITRLTGSQPTITKLVSSISSGLSGSSASMDKMRKQYEAVYDLWQKSHDPTKTAGRQS